MSLLLDALKKAEEAKRQAAEQAAAPSSAMAAPLALEPVGEMPATPATAASGLPDLSEHLDTVDAALAAISATPPLRGTSTANGKRPATSRSPQEAATAAAAKQEAARNVFAAKRTPPPDRSLLWLALGIALLLAMLIGGWFWVQLRAVGNTTLAPVAKAPAPATGTVVQPPAAPPPAETAGKVESAPVEAAPRPAEPRAERRSVPEAEKPVRITRGELQVAPELVRAYELLQADDLAGAAQAYEQALRQDPKNADALVGMGAIAVRRGDARAAETWFLKALEADPKDVNAQAGLIGLHGRMDPSQAESRLKNLLAQQPESPTLHFALGNLYAGQRRWADAQLAYFNAHTADPSNPDYLFNLAASLDHLHLARLASDYYKAALAASGTRRPSFNPDQVKARVQELQP